MSLQIFPIKIGLNKCYIIQDEGTILVDAGHPKQVRKFRKAFKKLNIDPTEIRLIVLTHGDPDHVGSVKDIKTLTGAKIAIHNLDRKNLEQAILNFPSGVSFWGKFLHVILWPVLKRVFSDFPTATADIVLNDEDYPLNEFGIDGKIVHTPGHTPGSVSVLLNTGEAFVGCMAHNNLPFRFTPGLPIFAGDIGQVKKSWKKIIQKGAKKIYPGHGNPFSADFIEKAIKE